MGRVCVFDSRDSSIFDRATEIAVIKLETDEDWQKCREERRAGAVKVELDHERWVLRSGCLEFVEAFPYWNMIEYTLDLLGHLKAWI